MSPALLMCVWAMILPSGALPGPRPQIPTTVRYEHHEAVRTRLHDLIPPALAEACDVAVAQGDPAEAIVHMVHEHHADLIVMGTHGKKSRPNLFDDGYCAV
jgi:nucleotide-binding universal stress UspA family protein